jgi:hypothetical protein
MPLFRYPRLYNIAQYAVKVVCSGDAWSSLTAAMHTKTPEVWPEIYGRYFGWKAQLLLRSTNKKAAEYTASTMC